MKVSEVRASVRGVVFLAGSLLLVICNWFAEGMLRNNGDYWRVAQLLHLSIHTGDVPSTSWAYVNGPSHHVATLFAALCRLLSIALKPLHLHTFNMLWLYVPLCVVYFAGTYLASDRLRGRSGSIIGVLYFAVFAIYGFITKSFYEESLLLILAPWLYWAIRVFHRTKKIVPVVVVGFCVVATKQQSVALTPAILAVMLCRSAWNRKTVTQVLAVLTALLVAAVTLNARISVFRYTDANPYDRLMNGVGAAMGNIAFQSGAHADQWRHDITDSQGYARPPVSGRDSCSAIPKEVRQFLGSANWPLGMTIREADPAEYKRILDAGRWGSFLTILGTCPIPTAKLVLNMTVATVRTDYRVDYIRSQQSRNPLLQPFLWFRNTCLHFWGWAMAFLALLTLVKLRSWKQRLVGVFCFLMLPFGVIGGDGFYEFEKHTLVYIGYFPLIYLLFRARRPAPEAQ